MSNELITLEQFKPLQAFSTDQGLDPVIQEIRERVKKESFDISTKEGRTAMRSFAKFGIGSSKTMLQNMSNDLTEDWKAKTKVVRVETNRMAEEIDKIRDEFLKPLIEFENIKKERDAKFESLIQIIIDAAVFEFEPTIENIKDRITKIENYIPTNFEEFTDRKELRIKASLEILNEKLITVTKQKEEQEELEKLRKEKAEREQKERDENIKQEAAAAAKKQAEDKARVDKEESDRVAQAALDKVEADKLAAENARIDAENRAKEAEEKAEREAEAAKIAQQEAVKREAERIEAEKQAEIDAEAARESDKAHKAKIHNEAMEAIAKIAGSTPVKDSPAKSIIIAIAKGEIPHVKISY